MLDGELGWGAREQQLERDLACRLVDGCVICLAQGAYILRQLGWMILYVTPKHRSKGPVKILGFPVGLRMIRPCERIIDGEKLADLLEQE